MGRDDKCIFQPQVHRGGGWGGEETVEISGSVEAKDKAQKLINDLITPQGFRGVRLHMHMYSSTSIYVLCMCGGDVQLLLALYFQEVSTPPPAVSTSPLVRGGDKGYSACTCT